MRRKSRIILAFYLSQLGETNQCDEEDSKKKQIREEKTSFIFLHCGFEILIGLLRDDKQTVSYGRLGPRRKDWDGNIKVSFASSKMLSGAN